MERRSFMSFLAAGAGASAFGAASPDKHIRFYSADFFNLKNGTQPARIHEHIRNGMLPALKRALGGPALVMEALVAPHMPQVAVFIGGKTFEDLWNINTRVGADGEYRKAQTAWEQGDEPAYESLNSMILGATRYSPELAVDKEPRKTPRIFELRVYHSPTWRQLAALHERVAGPEIQIFHRSGILPVLYTSTVVGPNMPNLTYLIPFDSLDAREKAWAKFGADPEWIKVRKESIDKHGQISSIMQISLYRAMAYSPAG